MQVSGVAKTEWTTGRLCILHAGQPKTGTTSLQNFLTRNAAALLQRGILYPTAGRAVGLRRNSHLNHGGAFRTLSGGRALGLPPGLPDALGAEIDTVPHEVLLLSSEHLVQMLFITPRPPVWRFLRDRGYEIETVTYVRDQPDYLNSAYVQQVKNAHEADHFDAYAARRSAVGDEGPVLVNLFFRELVRPRHREWGHHTFRPFGRDVTTCGIEADFLSVLHEILARNAFEELLPQDEAAALPVPARMNESDGPLMVAAGRRLAGLIGGQFPKRRLRYLTRGVYEVLAAEIAERGIVEPRYSALTAERYARIRDIFRETNALFAKRAWGCGWEDEFPQRDGASFRSNDIDEIGDTAAARLADDIVATVLPRVEELIRKGKAELAQAAARHAGSRRAPLFRVKPAVPSRPGRRG